MNETQYLIQQGAGNSHWLQQGRINYCEGDTSVYNPITYLNNVNGDKQCLPLLGNRKPIWYIFIYLSIYLYIEIGIYVLKKRDKWRALVDMHAEEFLPQEKPPPLHEALHLLYGEYFLQGSGKQNLFAFLQSTFNFLLSFVPVGIFPYFILCSFGPPVERDFHWNSCPQGPAPCKARR